MTLFLDTETFNEMPISAGVHRYCETVEVTILAWVEDDGDVHVEDLTRYPVSDAFSDAWRRASLRVAHNVPFDRPVMQTLGFNAPLESWHCTMAQALAHSLPGSLQMLSGIYNLGDSSKDKAGKALMMLFCKPRPKNSNIRRATRETHPEEWQGFLDYAGQDVIAMRELYHKMPRWNLTEGEREAWITHERINERGFAVDRQLAEQAVILGKRVKDDLQDRTYEITGTDLSVTQRDALLLHLLLEYGVQLPDMRAATLERRIEDESLPDPVRELLQIRLFATKTSNAKWAKLLACASSDDRLRGTAQFCGANRTGRISGRLFQPLNLPRPPQGLKKQIPEGIDFIRHGVADLIYDAPMEMASAALRGAIVAPPGKKLCVADLNAVEGRITAWHAGEEWVVEAYREFDHGRGHEMYVQQYAQAFRVTPESVMANDAAGGPQRQVGKVLTLLCGFGGSVGAVTKGVALYGLEMSEADMLTAVKAYRAANQKTKDFWYALEDTVKVVMTMASGGYQHCHKLKVVKSGAWLRIELPSGRSLSYASPKLELNRFGRQGITFLGVNNYTRKWERIETYGGKLTENCLTGDTQILTPYGWVPIVDATTTMRVWDGHSFVAHEGLVAQGEKPTIRLHGVGITKEHKVWVDGKWVEAGGCSEAASSFARHFGAAFRDAMRVALCGQQRKEKPMVDWLRLRKTIRDGGQRFYESAAKILRLRQAAFNRSREHSTRYEHTPCVLGMAVDGGSLHASHAPGMGALRRSGHNGLRAMAQMFREFLGGHGEKLRPRVDARPREQLERLFVKKLSLGKSGATSEKHSQQSCDRHAERENACSGSVRAIGDRRHHAAVPRSKQLPDAASVRHTTLCEPVFDLINCGPRHRFVVRAGEGLPPFLVHNCVQATARDVLVDNCAQIEAEGYPIVMTCYDEVAAETPDTDEFTAERLSQMLATVPHWAQGLPLAASGFEAYRYKKD